jgi:outer membrane protein OmpA-like peptidoglycan-associated protein
MTLSARHLLLGTLTLAGLGAGCAAMAPAQLREARDGYARSSTGLAASLAPAELSDGKRLLDRANAEYEDRGDTLGVRDQAYLAGRKFEQADARARTEADRRYVAEAMAAGVQVRDDQARSSRAALEDVRGQLGRERQANDSAARALQGARDAEGQELALRREDARQARSNDQVRLEVALHELSQLAVVREDPRGLVVTLDSAALFSFGRDTLLDSARPRLDRLAEALRSQSLDRRMVVEGHTDNLASDAVNFPLSSGRAQAVRDYLVSRGLDGARVTSVGLGATRPLVGNSSAQNRASNRRVEIVLQPPGLTIR